MNKKLLVSALLLMTTAIVGCGNPTPSENNSVEPSTNSTTNSETKPSENSQTTNLDGKYYAYVNYDDGEPVADVQVQWCVAVEGGLCLIPIRLTAKNGGLAICDTATDELPYVVHVLRLDETLYAYNPNLNVVDSSNKGLNIVVYTLQNFGDDNSIESTGVYKIALENEVIVSFKAPKAGTYTFESWHDMTATSQTKSFDPSISSLGNNKEGAVVASDDNSGYETNFKFDVTCEKDEVVYLKLSATVKGDLVFNVSEKTN